ncbi:hypothetical protein LZ198_37485 [Myxococcus sp. K15C18031901]|uniref:hypothetical protein n=1 Tax=Myxococcus dinghuensis TaxID=2906761 RepID=UPI0020A80A24|nr:hypothetical protein [Myxococcus dinghuensis]MCP3104571.1 hypothetical protein [Myxococcus dinghuensis]
MVPVSRVLALVVPCLLVACGGGPSERAEQSEVGTTEQPSRPCSSDAGCPDTQTCVSGTCLPRCEPTAPACGGLQCCPPYRAQETGPLSQPYCAPICFG